MKQLIKNNLTGKKVLLYFTISTTLYIVMLLFTIPRVMAYSGGMKILDMMPAGYNAGYVFSLLQALGEPGRKAYLFGQIPLDLIYPYFFAVSNCLILAWFLHKMGKFETRFLMLCILPLLSGIFDYFENFSIITLLIKFPDIPHRLIKTANLFSILKSVFVSVSLSVMLIVISWWAIIKLFHLSKK